MAEEKEPHEQIYRRKRTIFVNNFVGGIGWGLGATVGLSIFFAILTFVAKNINFVPIVGNFVAQVANFVAQSQHVIR